MSEFQMTHVALVGARIDAFHALGFRSRSELAMRRVAPDPNQPTLVATPEDRLRNRLALELPLWVHNTITDPTFPDRERLVMGLRRFEGELRDNRENEVVAAVLSAGFSNRPLDPLHPPSSMSMRQRCAMSMQIGPWRDAYESLEAVVVEVLSANTREVDGWVKLATRHPELAPEQAVAV